MSTMWAAPNPQFKNYFQKITMYLIIITITNNCKFLEGSLGAVLKVCMRKFISHSQPPVFGTVVYPYYKRGYWCPERLCQLPNVTELVRVKGEAPDPWRPRVPRLAECCTATQGPSAGAQASRSTELSSYLFYVVLCGSHPRRDYHVLLMIYKYFSAILLLGYPSDADLEHDGQTQSNPFFLNCSTSDQGFWV